MKKVLIIGCSIIAIIAVAVLIACGVISYQGYSGYMGTNTKVVEEMLGSKIPPGYMPVMAMNDMQGKSSAGGKMSFAMLMKVPHMVVLLAVPRIKDEAEKQFLVEGFKKGIQQQNQNSYSNQKIDINPDGVFVIKGKSYPKYKVKVIQNAQESEGIAIFIDYPTKTILFVYMSEVNTFKPEEAKAFLEAINLPK